MKYKIIGSILVIIITIILYCIFGGGESVSEEQEGFNQTVNQF